MRRSAISINLVLGLLVGGNALAGSVEIFVFQLSGGQENPPVATSATGGCMGVLDAGAAEFDLVCAHNVVGTTAAHIHRAVAGINGPIVFGLGDPSTSPFQATWTGMTTDDIDDLRGGRLYVNIHAATHPGGENRGQILERTIDRFPFPAAGAQELPPNASPAEGACVADLNDEATMLLVQCSHDVVGATAAHIHNAERGVGGPVVFPFAGPASPFSGVMNVAPADVAEMAAGFFYVNIHSVEFNAGEIRGQMIDNRIFTDGFESGDLSF